MWELFYLFSACILTCFIRTQWAYKILYHAVQRNGCFAIKLTQWICARNNLLENTNIGFENIFEKNEFHSLDHTKSQFQKDFGFPIDSLYTIDNCVSSGSIAQVYKAYDKVSESYVAIKARHPHVDSKIHFQWKIFKFVVNAFKFLKISNVFQIFQYMPMDSFLENFLQQIDLRIEAKNMQDFYDHIKQQNGENVIIIPKCIMSSPNFIIMSYEESSQITSIDDQYKRYKYAMTLLMFAHETCYFLHKTHCDLHNGNWGIRDNGSIVVYDFGYIINQKKERSVEILKWKQLYERQQVDDMNRFMVEHWIEHNYHAKLPMPNKCVNKPINIMTALYELIEYCKIHNVILKSQLIEFMIFFNCMEKVMTENVLLFRESSLKESMNVYHSNRKEIISFCKSKNMFPNLVELFESYSDENSKGFNKINTNDVFNFYNKE